MLEILYHRAKFGGYRISPASAAKAAKNVEFLGRLLGVHLNNIRGGNVRPSVGTSIRPSTKSFSDFNEIWCVDRGR